MPNQNDSGLSLKDDIASIRTDPIFHDVTIVCSDGVEIGACRAVLASRSAFFKAMLYGNMQESTSHKVVLQDIKSVAFHAVLRFIHTEDIDSTAISAAVDVYRAADFLLLPKLMKLVRGELDWIVMKALEKDRTRRYETASGFARDIQRYLDDEVVEALPASTGYRIRKFVRRHRGHVIGAGLVMLALLAGIVGTAWGLFREARAKTRLAASLDRETKANSDLSAANAKVQARYDLAVDAGWLRVPGHGENQNHRRPDGCGRFRGRQINLF